MTIQVWGAFVLVGFILFLMLVIVAIQHRRLNRLEGLLVGHDHAIFAHGKLTARPGERVS